MKLINKLGLLTEKEREFLETPKIQRSKESFKNPTVLRKRIREKSNNLLSDIHYLIKDIDLLYKFRIEDGLECNYNTNIPDELKKLPDNQLDIVLKEISPILTLMLNDIINDDSSSDFLKSIDAKKLLFLEVSQLYGTSLEEYEEAFKQTYKIIRNFSTYTIPAAPVIYQNILATLSKNFNEQIPPILNFLWGINDLDERSVAFLVYMSENGITRNGIAEQTGLDKRYVTRYTKKLIGNKTIKKVAKSGIDYYFWDCRITTKSSD